LFIDSDDGTRVSFVLEETGVPGEKPLGQAAYELPSIYYTMD